jgi:uncharacterized membrane protein YphA (DoxX/SURF4 family)
VGIYLAVALVTSGESKLGQWRQAIAAASLIAMTTLAILYAHGFWVV